MSDNPLREAFEQTRQRSVVAAEVYAALKAAKKLSSHRMLSYRCDSPSHCMLLDVVRLPQGLIFHTPTYKLSPVMNDAGSSASGRAKNTRDGERHWKPQTYFQVDAVNVSLNCDHLTQVVLDISEIADDLAARHTEMLVSLTGARRTR